MRYAGYVACMVKGFVHSFCFRKPNRTTPFGTPRHRRMGNITKDIQETEWRTRIGLIWVRTGTWQAIANIVNFWVW